MAAYIPPGLWLTSPAGWLPRTGISSGTLRSVIEYGLPFLPVVTGRCRRLSVYSGGKQRRLGRTVPVDGLSQAVSGVHQLHPLHVRRWSRRDCRTELQSVWPSRAKVKLGHVSTTNCCLIISSYWTIYYYYYFLAHQHKACRQLKLLLLLILSSVV